jgi:hypothetical protein
MVPARIVILCTLLACAALVLAALCLGGRYQMTTGLPLARLDRFTGQVVYLHPAPVETPAPVDPYVNMK